MHGAFALRENTYTWGITSPPYTMNGTMVTTFLANLNSGGGFAGHTDWRIPNRNELLSLTNTETVSPATYPAFHYACTDGCTVTTCTCTQSDYNWSSTTRQDYPLYAWVVSFADGATSSTYKTDGFYVRAIRESFART